MKLWNWHVQDTVVILEEGNLPHQQCPLCDILLPWRYLNGLYQRIWQCKKGPERGRQRLVSEEEKAVSSRAIRAYGPPLEMVTSSRYLGRVI